MPPLTHPPEQVESGLVDESVLEHYPAYVNSPEGQHALTHKKVEHEQAIFHRLAEAVMLNSVVKGVRRKIATSGALAALGCMFFDVPTAVIAGCAGTVTSLSARLFVQSRLGWYGKNDPITLLNCFGNVYHGLNTGVGNSMKVRIERFRSCLQTVYKWGPRWWIGVGFTLLHTRREIQGLLENVFTQVVTSSESFRNEVTKAKEVLKELEPGKAERVKVLEHDVARQHVQIQELNGNVEGLRLEVREIKDMLTEVLNAAGMSLPVLVELQAEKADARVALGMRKGRVNHVALTRF